MTEMDPQQLSQAFAAAIRGGDTEAACALFEDSALLTTQQGQVCEGAEAIRDLLTQYAGMRPPLEIRNLKTLRTSDLALMYNAPRHGEAEGRAVEVARRQADGTWRYVMVFHPTG